MISAIIFDLYGTLLRPTNGSQPFLRLARRTSSVRKALEIAMTTENSTLIEFSSRIGLELNDEDRIADIALAAELDSIQPFADAEPTLLELKRNGIRTAVISNLASPYKKPFFSHQFNLLIDFTAFSCDCGLLKPDSRIYEQTMKQLGVSPSDTIMVGDSLMSDVDGPSKSGIKGIHLVRSGMPSKAPLVISSLDGVLQHLQ